MDEIKRGDLVKWFSELTNKDVAIAGGKGASLAEMYNNKFPVPPGFVVTAQAYRHFMESSGASEKVRKVLEGLDIEDTGALNEVSKKIRKIIEGVGFPKDLESEILESYDVLDVNKKGLVDAGGGALDILRTSHEPPFVAVRSSATTEDLVDASFAGQQDSFMNVKGEKELLLKVKKCFSSLFTARAIYYREKKGFEHDKSYVAVVIQKMVDSYKSGVMFSKNPLKNDNSIMIEAVWGLGEGIVSGKILPDHYVLSKDLEILETKISEKKIAITRDSSGKIVTVTLTPERSARRVLSGHELKKLAQYALKLEEHYEKPQDIEFAIENDEIFIVQSRPITTKAKMSSDEVEGNVLLSGLAASPGVSSGTVKIIHTLDDLEKIKKGDVLVAKMTNPDMVVSMQKASGIITDEGGVTSHAAIVSREMGIPAIVGTGDATVKLREGQVVTVDGYNGKVLEGKGVEKKVEIHPIVETKTNIKVIVDLPDYAEKAAKSGAKSVGLVRMETIIAGGGKHPNWYLKKNKVEDYVKLLYDGFRKLALPFKEVWLRTSDIRSDEFRNLEGAPQEVEGNPMLGYHGIRFSLRNVDLLEGEFKAIKDLADEFPDKTFGIMAPQIISVEELREMKKVVKEVGLPENIKIGIMVETPASVQIINDLCEEGIDFVSFGTNDLTQYTLAIDRNNPEIQELYDAMNPAVLNSIRYVIRRCKRYKVETSICGQAGSNPKMAKFLVKHGIDSISVNPDAAQNVSEIVAEVEKKMRDDEVVEQDVKEGKNFEKGSNFHTKKERYERIIDDKKSEIASEGVGFSPKVELNEKENKIEEKIVKELDGLNIKKEDDFVEAISRIDEDSDENGMIVDSEKKNGNGEDEGENEDGEVAGDERKSDDDRDKDNEDGKDKSVGGESEGDYNSDEGIEMRKENNYLEKSAEDGGIAGGEMMDDNDGEEEGDGDEDEGESEENDGEDKDESGSDSEGENEDGANSESKKKTDEILSDEEIILQKLESDSEEIIGIKRKDEYQPSFGKDTGIDVPSLNEAIPVGSEDFVHSDEKEGMDFEKGSEDDRGEDGVDEDSVDEDSVDEDDRGEDGVDEDGVEDDNSDEENYEKKEGGEKDKESHENETDGDSGNEIDYDKKSKKWSMYSNNPFGDNYSDNSGRGGDNAKDEEVDDGEDDRRGEEVDGGEDDERDGEGNGGKIDDERRNKGRFGANSEGENDEVLDIF